MQQKDKICPHCKMEVDQKATRCPNCHGKIIGWTKATKILAVIIGFVIMLSVLSGGKEETKEGTAQTQKTQDSALQQLISKEQAQAELDEIIKLGKDALLVTSYDFSENVLPVVYVSDLWYGLDVTFKKDFLAGIAIQKNIITGYRYFEVRHFQSNEKVAEVTAFGGSLEVYK